MTDETMARDEYLGGQYTFGKEIFDVLIRLKFAHNERGRLMAAKFVLPPGYTVVAKPEEKT